MLPTVDNIPNVMAAVLPDLLPTTVGCVVGPLSFVDIPHRVILECTDSFSKISHNLPFVDCSCTIDKPSVSVSDPILESTCKMATVREEELSNTVRLFI